MVFVGQCVCRPDHTPREKHGPQMKPTEPITAPNAKLICAFTEVFGHGVRWSMRVSSGPYAT